jgi:hypothetical protein
MFPPPGPRPPAILFTVARRRTLIKAGMRCFGATTSRPVSRCKRTFKNSAAIFWRKRVETDGDAPASVQSAETGETWGDGTNPWSAVAGDIVFTLGFYVGVGERVRGMGMESWGGGERGRAIISTDYALQRLASPLSHVKCGHEFVVV